MALYITSRYGFLLYQVVYVIGETPTLHNNVSNDMDSSLNTDLFPRCKSSAGVARNIEVLKRITASAATYWTSYIMHFYCLFSLLISVRIPPYDSCVRLIIKGYDDSVIFALRTFAIYEKSLTILVFLISLGLAKLAMILVREVVIACCFRSLRHFPVDSSQISTA